LFFIFILLNFSASKTGGGFIMQKKAGGDIGKNQIRTDKKV
jgi:hypothetical protein